MEGAAAGIDARLKEIRSIGFSSCDAARSPIGPFGASALIVAGALRVTNW